MIIAADYMRNFHCNIVDYNSEIVRWKPIRTLNDQVVELLVFKNYCPTDQVPHYSLAFVDREKTYCRGSVWYRR